MAVFQQKAELNRQKRHIAFEGDDSFGLKLLGFNEKGQRNAWGQVLSYLPGVNTATHALAKNAARGDAGEVIDNTFDEAISKDLAGAAFGVNLAKSFINPGAGLKGLAGKFGGGGDAANAVTGGTPMEGASNALSQVAGGSEGEAPEGGMFKNAFRRGMSLLGKDNTTGQAFDNMLGEVADKSIKNPFEPGTEEYDAFENDRSNQQKSQNREALKNGFKNAMSGNLIESGLNFATMSIASHKAQKNEYENLRGGKFAFNPEFNYL